MKVADMLDHCRNGNPGCSVSANERLVHIDENDQWR